MENHGSPGANRSSDQGEKNVMKFANRYELSDPLTTGAVETFAALDMTSGERVVVHIFETPPQASNLEGQASYASVLKLKNPTGALV